ncbi:MAG: acetyl-CoA carboxylase biotin carboxyl carrier protein [Treponema sp.]|nr:acetyl-CoA carboxylase biotin carboxyl carrier protein [Treponema sp.]
MEYEKIKQLMDDMGNSKLTSIDIEFPDGIKIKMEKKNETQVVVSTQDAVVSAPVQTVTTEVSSNVVAEVTAPVVEEVKGEIVKSPMIGTFYSKPSPTSNPYVEVGTQVKKGDVLCIIEAMKLMNEIEAECDGKIAEILVKDGEAVDYGKPLFKIV